MCISNLTVKLSIADYFILQFHSSPSKSNNAAVNFLVIFTLFVYFFSELNDNAQDYNLYWKQVITNHAHLQRNAFHYGIFHLDESV
jgi:hypothetical protein